MKRILWIIKKEAFLLAKPLIMLSLIFLFFTSAFFSMVLVRKDLSINMYQNIDNEISDVYVTVYFSSFNDIDNFLNDDMIIIGKKAKLTSDTILKAENGNEFHTTQINQEDEKINMTFFSGSLIFLNENLSRKFNYFKSTLLSGEWNTSKDQISLSKYIADSLFVTVGDSLMIYDDEYYITGIYDYNELNQIDSELSTHFYITKDKMERLDEISIGITRASSAFSAYQKLQRSNYDVSFSDFYLPYFNNIKTMEIFLLAISVILFLVIIIIVYSLISIILLQRSRYISQLKTFGMRETQIMFSYCSLTSTILVTSTIISYFCSYLFNQYIMDVSSKLFETNFIPKGSFIIAMKFVFAILTTIICSYLMVNKRLSSNRIASMVKEE